MAELDVGGGGGRSGERGVSEERVATRVICGGGGGGRSKIPPRGPLSMTNVDKGDDALLLLLYV